MQQHHNHNAEPVASEPRLFVGQVPTDKTAEDLAPLFEPFGVIKNLHLVKGPDGKSRGCAMVLYEKWSQAEAAMEAHDGKTVLEGGKNRPLVVHFANPRKANPAGLPPEQGVAPKKVFVGQVPRDITEEQLRPMFASCGEILHLNILRTQRGQSAGCAFVQYRKWAEAEAAIEMHNGKTVLPGGEVPLVVKFADARKRDVNGARRLGAPGWDMQMDRRALNGGMHEGFLQGQLGMPTAANMNTLVQAYNGSYAGGQFGDQAGLLTSLGVSPALGGSLGLSNPMGNASFGSMQGMDATGGAGVVGATQGLSAMAGLQEAYAQGMGGYGAQGLQTMQGLGAMGGQREADLTGANGLANAGFSPYGATAPGLYGSQYGQYAQLQQTHQQHTRLGSGGANEVTNQWKLFVGQLPPDATEQDLWSLFAPLGEILELYILRGPNGLSRGCGFVTYANKYLAEQAIQQLNGRQVPPGKVLVVKLADRSLPNRQNVQHQY